MDNESDWVADVRRWCLAGARAKVAAPALSTGSSSSSAGEVEDVGYEAAHPALQSRHWPDAPNGAPADMR